MSSLTPEAPVHIKEIEFLKSRYCRAIDNKEWDLLPTLFVNEARFEGFGGISKDATVAEFVALIAQGLEGSITVHHLHHHEIDTVDADHARAVWAMMDYNEWPNSGSALRSFPEATGYCGYGFYEETYKRYDSSWRIEFMRLVRIRRDPLLRGTRDNRFNPFERRGSLAPSPDWLNGPANRRTC